MTTRKELLPGVFLTSIQDGRFKTACFSLSFLRPLRAGEAAMNALLPSVLLRGSEKTPSIRAIADRLDELHGASIGALVRKKGEIQLTGLFADCLEDQYAGEAVFSHLLDFVSELLFCPRTEHGAFVPELVSQECRNLQNAMQSVLDDKSAYCERQLLRAMCRGERYACGRLGEPEELDKIDVRTSGRTISRCWPRRAWSFSISAANPSEKRRRCCSRFWRICRARPASRSGQTPARSRRRCGGFLKLCRLRRAGSRWASARM